MKKLRVEYPTLAWARSADGSAPHSHCGGREFEPPRVHQVSPVRKYISIRDGKWQSRRKGLSNLVRKHLVVQSLENLKEQRIGIIPKMSFITIS